MRRSSVFAPLLLIGLGVLFLARNLYPDLPVMDFIARYWPFILILWGGLRLLEILYWAASSKPLPASGISGGEWILVVFLCLIGSGMNAVRGYNTWWPHGSIRMGGLDVFGESFEYPVSAEKPSSKTPHIVIENFRGTARVIGADADEVKVTGRKMVRALQQGDADKVNRQTPFELISQG
ncbi:MAG: LiaI-LiaF-like domain-containing protein, partial [Bryobacteraceae bacterium]